MAVRRIPAAAFGLSLLLCTGMGRAQDAPSSEAALPTAAITPRATLMPLPENYAKKFGTGAAGAQAAAQVLLNRKSSRESITEALDAVTYYGHEGARALLAFTTRQLRRNQEERANDTSWYIPIADAMAKVPDTASLGPLLHWARYGDDPALRSKALKVMAMLVANAAYDVPTGDANGSTVHITGMVTHHDIRSLGNSITLDDLGAIKAMGERLLADPQTPASVRQEATTLMWWVNAREEQDKKAVESLRAMGNGETPPDGSGYGGFGTPPTAE